MADKDLYIENALLKEWMKDIQADELKKTGVRVSYKEILFKYLFGVPYDSVIPEKLSNLPRPILTRYMLQKNK